MIKKRKIILLFLTIAIIFSCFLTCFAPTTIQSVSASSIGVVGGYTNVIDDLEKDDVFDANNYPYNGEDYSLQVLNVAESSDNELFVYVYQPCSPNEDLTATSIKISTDIGRNLSYKMYKLTLINSNGCFYKYLVNNFVVSTQMTRYYDISVIHRLWNEKYDKGLSPTNENTISETPFVVGKEFTFKSTENGIEISFRNVDLIEIVDKYVGFCRYTSSNIPPIWFDNVNFDGHFVAFSTDRDIDRLMEADVFYRTQYRKLRVNLGVFEEVTCGEIEDNYSYLKYTDKVTVAPEIGFGGITHHKYSWDRIQTATEFVETENREYMYGGVLFNSTTEVKLTDEELQDIKNMQWVLRFAETEFTQVIQGTGLLSPYIETQVLVSDVSILRLAFETDDVFYNLGVIDNLQSGDGNPGNYIKTTFEATDTLKIVLAILFLIVLLIVLSPILPIIFSFIWCLIKIIFKIVIWVISLPFKLIKAIFKKRE